MTVDSIREFCLSLPHATEDLKWGDNLLFRVGGKMFAVLSLEPDNHVRLSFKCTPEEFAELVEQPGIIPAPYLARAHWVGLERLDALWDSELRDRLRRAHELVFAGLPKKTKEGFASGKPDPRAKKAPRRRLA